MFHLIVHRPLNSGGGVYIAVQTDVKIIFLRFIYVHFMEEPVGVLKLRKHGWVFGRH